MRHPTISRAAVLAALAIVALVPASIQASDQEQGGEPAFERVPLEHVCMVNDTYFARDQIPVEVDGKTYYGCCQGCKTRLQEDAAIRRAVDPTTGAEVDKAIAVAVARPDGSVMYFDNEENLERYLKGSR